jgi:hypothetical protein
MTTTNNTNLLRAVLALALSAYGQTSRGTVAGTVLDSTGAVIGGAHVSMTGVDTGVKLSTESNAAGVYRFDAVDLGVYQLQVAHPGFRTYVGTGINVEANRVTTFDPRLEVGAAETRIEVSGESSEVLVKDSPLPGRELPAARGARSAVAWAESALARAHVAGRHGRRWEYGQQRCRGHRRDVLDQWPAPARQQLHAGWDR